MLQQLIINGIIAGSIYALIAIGFTIIHRTTNILHFAHGIVYALGAYIAYTFYITLHFNLILSILFATASASFVGICIDRLIYYPLRRQGAPSLVFLLASFGVFVFVQNLLQLIYGAQTLTMFKDAVTPGHFIFGIVITEIQLKIIFCSIFFVILFWLFIQRTKIGKMITAVGDDPEGASVIGINPEKIIIITFAIGSAMAGLSGILISFEKNIEPMMGFTAFLKAVVATVVGGIGSIPGAFLGGILLGLMENIGIYKIQSGWKDCIAFVLLIIFLLFRPHGILGIKAEKENT
jgi:branched-chain amino acid transport system permease protein